MRARHPWVFSGALARIEGTSDGETVDVLSSEGKFLGRGYYNSRSQIAVRMWTTHDEPVDRAFLRRRLETARRLREDLGLRLHDPGAATTAFRLVNAESDLLPGLVTDAYDDRLVVQFLTLGVERRRDELLELVQEVFSPRGIWERSDVDVRPKEGLEERAGWIAGDLSPQVEVRENGLRFVVDLARGHKTGFYLDQRENRARAAALLAGVNAPRELVVLNAFAYTGAFGVSLANAHPRARVLNLEASGEALALARENFERNGLAARADYAEGDAFHLLRRYRDAARQFDAIVLDPPKFAYTEGQVNAACRGYKDLNLLAFKLLKPGSYLFTFSCSGLVPAALFQQVVFEAAQDAGRDVQILARFGHAPDHPILLAFPEGEYLKGLALWVV